MYNVSMGEARCEAVGPGIFLPVLMIGGKCFCLRAKAAHISQGNYQGHSGSNWERGCEPTFTRIIIQILPI